MHPAVWRILPLVMLAGLATLALVQGSGGETRYEFDHVEAEYAARFVIDPMNVDDGNWAANLSGVANGSLNITYGVVRYWRENSSSTGREEFLRIDGTNGSRRLVANGVSTEYFPNTTSPQRTRSFFWTAKQLENNTVVKNFTRPIYSIEIMRVYDEAGNITDLKVSTSNDGEEAQRDWWAGFPTINVWQARMDSAEQAGDPDATGGSA